MWRECKSRQPLLFHTAAANALLLAVCVCLTLIDDTQITGVNRWIKPMKFTASVSIYLGAMAWYWPYSPAASSMCRFE